LPVDRERFVTGTGALVREHGLVIGILLDLVDQELLAEMPALAHISLAPETQLLGYFR
jgi:hypothetical protein